ncbi:hypothetical protein NMW18_07410, partial [Pasteurella multocida]|nr:hypothetical protein [Pasteurella multocida]
VPTTDSKSTYLNSSGKFDLGLKSANFPNFRCSQASVKANKKSCQATPDSLNLLHLYAYFLLSFAALTKPAKSG